MWRVSVRSAKGVQDRLAGKEGKAPKTGRMILTSKAAGGFGGGPSGLDSGPRPGLGDRAWEENHRRRLEAVVKLGNRFNVIRFRPAQRYGHACRQRCIPEQEMKAARDNELVRETERRMEGTAIVQRHVVVGSHRRCSPLRRNSIGPGKPVTRGVVKEQQRHISGFGWD